VIERTDNVNWSTLKHIRTSPKHYRHALTHPRPDTPALLLGRLTHCMVYEADQVDSRYLIAPRFHGGMKDDNARAAGYDGGKEAKREWEQRAVLSGADIVSGDLYSLASAMRDALLADPIAGPMVRGGYSEQRITWTDARTGIECRGRVDHVNGIVSDLKTTRSIAPRLFGSDAARYSYHAQLAWYADGLASCGIVTGGPPAIVAVENEPPHDVAVYGIDDDTLAAGRAEYRKALDLLAWCRAHDEWPGVAGGSALELRLPAWAAPEPQAEEITLGGERLFPH
jgi:hypothetical protein